MPMRSEMIHQIYIADGFHDDCDLLIQRCVKAERLNYGTFCEIWKDMQFDCIYVGRTSTVEIAELSEEFVHIAKQYMMAQTNNFEETVAGLFLLYGLLNLQPYPGFAVLRLTPEDVPQVKKIEDTARRERRHDVLYILGVVLIKHTQYHAEQRQRGIEQVYRKYLEDYISIDRSGYRPRGVFYRQTEELDIIRELAAVTVRYDNAKRAVTGGKTDPSLSYINKSLPTELDASLKRIINGITTTPDDEKDAADVHYSKVQAIKDKAMRNVVGGIRHLTSSAERTHEKSQPIVSEIKSKPGKVKTSSPTKTFISPKKKGASKSPRRSTTPKLKSPKKTRSKLIAKASTSKPLKHKLSPKRTKQKIKKRKPPVSSSDSDINLSDLEDSDSDFSNISLSSGDDIDLINFNKPQELSKDIIEIEIDDSRRVTAKDVLVTDPETIDKLQKLKAKIASLEAEVNNSTSNEKVNNTNGDNEESSNSQENVDDSEETESTEDIFKRPKTKRNNFLRRLCKLGVLPVADFPEKRQARQSQSDSASERTENIGS